MAHRKIQMTVTGVLNSSAENGTFLLMLREADGERTLSIPIGQFEAQTLLIELRGIEPSRPLMHVLFAAVLNVVNVKLLHILIYKVKNGIFYSYLYLKSEEAIIRVDARPSDAVTLALQTQATILVYEELLDGNEKAEGKRITDPDAAFSEENMEAIRNSLRDTLQKAMQKAVDEEDYERAAVLRDRLKLLDKK